MPAPLPASELVALSQVLAAMNISASTWWHGIKVKRFPQPVRLGLRCVRWRTEEVRRVIDGTWPRGGVPGPDVPPQREGLRVAPVDACSPNPLTSPEGKGDGTSA